MIDDPAARIALAGQRHLAYWQSAIDDADPRGSVTPAARLLCCGLGGLAESAAAARANPNVVRAGRAAAGLALLTKIDDERIDSPGFHGGPRTEREQVRRRTEAFLAPTLAAVRTGRTRSREPRVEFAAHVGRELAACAIEPARLEALLDLIARGWAIQVDAVEVLSATPGTIPWARLSRVTAAISGAWLAMITGVGLLGADRGLSSEEEATFFAWGLAIQSADALADLEKDLADDFAASLPLALAIERDPQVLRAWRDRRGDHLRRLVVQTGADRAVLPDPLDVKAWDQRLRELGDVPQLLRWIHGFLLGRHLMRSPNTELEAFAPFVTDWEAFRATHAPGAPCSA